MRLIKRNNNEKKKKRKKERKRKDDIYLHEEESIYHSKLPELSIWKEKHKVVPHVPVFATSDWTLDAHFTRVTESKVRQIRIPLLSLDNESDEAAECVFVCLSRTALTLRGGIRNGRMCRRIWIRNWRCLVSLLTVWACTKIFSSLLNDHNHHADYFDATVQDGYVGVSIIHWTLTQTKDL